MAIVNWASPTLSVTFSQQEIQVIQRVMTSNPGALQNLITSWLAQRVDEFNQKDVQSIQTVLNVSNSNTIARVMAALGIPQS